MLYNVVTEGPLESRINSKKKSYAAWEIIQYQIFGKTINKWRMRTLKLPRIRGNLMQNSIPKEKIPFSAMWSENLLPRPQDWPGQCRVVGTCRFNQNNGKEIAFDPIQAGLQDLIRWLECGPKPIFIGFGSMVIENPETIANMIIIAAAKAQCRVLVQSGWAKIDVKGSVNGQDLPYESSCNFRGPLCFNVGSCPHDWLLPHCCAVIHHGGAGTTAAGLAHGLPTFICPFFGDQFMWADTVYRAAVGPKYCPIKDLEEDILAQALKDLRDPTIKLNAEKMAAAMAKENGIQGALDHFMDFLPVDNMFCDVSMLMGEVRRARYFLPGSDLKVSVEVAALIEMSKDKVSFLMIHWLTEIGAFKMRRYAVTKYSLSGGIHNVLDGLYYGTVGLFFQIGVQAPYKLFHLPDKYAFRCGAFGFCFGCLIGPLGMIFKILYALLCFVDCVTLGIVNGCSSPKNQREYICNIFHKDNSYVYRLANVEREREKIERDGIHEPRFSTLLNAFEVAVEAQRIFNLSNPKENNMHKILEVQTGDLRASVDHMSFHNNENKQKLKYALSLMKGDSVSFSKFCKLLHSIVGDEINSLSKGSKAGRKKVKVEYWDVYGTYCTDDQQSKLSQRETKPIVRVPVVGPKVKGARSYVSPQKKESIEKKPLSLSMLSSPRNLTEPISRFLGERGKTPSFESVPLSSAVHRLRVRTWSDGLANKIDQFSQTVAGGRCRSISPKHRTQNATPDASHVRLRTFSDGFNQTRKANASDLDGVI